MDSIAYLGIGTNIGDREKNIAEALERLGKEERLEILETSSFYNTEPVGGPEQGDYLNGVIKISTDITPENMIVLLKNIEKEMGRVESGRNYPRIIDIDILLYGGLIFRGEDLVIPHPRMHERGFVLKGLESIAPNEVHPVLNKTVAELYEAVKQG